MSKLAKAVDPVRKRPGQQPRWSKLDPEDRAKIIALRRDDYSAESISGWLTENGFQMSAGSVRNFLIEMGEW